MTNSIDLNCDMGESFGVYSLGNDAALMPLITSANIACGFHAGDPLIIDRTVKLAREHGVAVGAHPGFRDPAGFGRRVLDATPAEVEADVLYQIGAVAAFARAQGITLAHVKAHGALYNVAAVRPEIARAIARAIAHLDANLIMVGLAGSAMMAAAEEHGLPVAREGFADRAYDKDGTLRSRREPGSVHEDPRRVAQQALELVTNQAVTTPEGERVPLSVDTICIHGDHPAAVENARAVRELLERNGITLSPLNARRET